MATCGANEENVTRLPITLVIYGVMNTVQSTELYETLKNLEVGLRSYYPWTWFRMVIVTHPELLRHVSDADTEIMHHVYTMYVPDTGRIIYSGKNPSPPTLNEVCTHAGLQNCSLISTHLEYLSFVIRWYPP
jgi:hypothetical protein